MKTDKIKSKNVSKDSGIVPLLDNHTPAVPASDKLSPVATASDTAENKNSQDEQNAEVEASEPPGEVSVTFEWK